MSDFPFEVIGTDFETRHDIFGSRIINPICFGEGKVEKIKQWLNSHSESEFEFIESWSDDLSDKPMMELSKNRIWVCSKKNKKNLQHVLENEDYHLID